VPADAEALRGRVAQARGGGSAGGPWQRPDVRAAQGGVPSELAACGTAREWAAARRGGWS
jgi:hypothetical protein